MIGSIKKLMILNEPWESELITWDFIHSLDTKGMTWFISSASNSVTCPVQFACAKNSF